MSGKSETLSNGRSILKALPRVIRSLLMRDVLRNLETDKESPYYSSAAGVRLSISNQPSGRYVTKWIHKLRDDKAAIISTFEEEKSLVEALLKIALHKGWLYRVAQGQIDGHSLTQKGKGIIEDWDDRRSTLLAGLVKKHKEDLSLLDM